jgi:hypothetical protein
VFGNSAANDIIRFARQLQTSPPVLIEQHKHPGSTAVNSYDWAADLELLTNGYNETTGVTDAVPDFIVAATFARYYVPLIRTWRISGYDQRVSRMAHFHTLRIESAVNALGAFGEGQEGISHILLDDGASGQEFAAEYQKAYELSPVFWSSDYYDNAVLLMLATWRAARSLPVPTMVTGDQVRQALLGLEDTSAPIVRTGPSELTAAIQALDRGATVNYEGASGPVDYDANQNVKNRLSHFHISGQQYVDLENFDCIANSDTSTTAALATACPRITR